MRGGKARILDATHVAVEDVVREGERPIVGDRARGLWGNPGGARRRALELVERVGDLSVLLMGETVESVNAVGGRHGVKRVHGERMFLWLELLAEEVGTSVRRIALAKVRMQAPSRHRPDTVLIIIIISVPQSDVD